MSELLKINVNDHTEKKNGLTYLSWAWAWAEVLKVDPQAIWEPMDFNAEHGPFQLLCKMEDGTVFVGITVRIKGVSRRCMLPVMDNRNKAIPKPNAFDVNKAQMRCLAKAIAMHGLGLYIYAGEDLPESDTTGEDDLKEKLTRSIEIAKNAKGIPLGKGVIKPTEGAGAGLTDKRRAEMDNLALEIIEAHQRGQDNEAIRYWYDARNFEDNDERVYVWSQLGPYSKLRSTIKANNPQKEPA